MRRTAQLARNAERGLPHIPGRSSKPSVCLLCQRRRVPPTTLNPFTTPVVRRFSTSPNRCLPDPGVPAPSENEAATSNYRPAQTWDGLELVGGETEWPLDIEPEVFATKFIKRDKATVSDLLYQSVTDILSKRGHKDAPTRDESWLQIPLHDSQLKFDVLKRFFQISGTRIRDNVLDEIWTTGDLLEKAIAINYARPNQVALDLEEDGELTSLPNVSLARAKRTYIDKERDIGRLKVIVDTLTRKNLPVRPKERLARQQS